MSVHPFGMTTSLRDWRDLNTPNASKGWESVDCPFGMGASRNVEFMKTQEAHHRRMSFKEKFLGLLKKHWVAYDEGYLWD